MKINIIAVGKIKDKHLASLVSEYTKLISRFASVHIKELDEKDAERDDTIILKQLGGAFKQAGSVQSQVGLVVALVKEGQQFTSEAFADFIDKAGLKNSTITFLIGGSNGLPLSVLEKADLSLSFGQFTYPHKLFRVMLLEQLYRAFSIKHNHPYHK
ncbi:MAG: 23S rRNA (pseudouridine(1915)-N(3))-methyltransferase RlmH [Firmicutes bacterium]|nr:23S rRNA (pseudouridine(1915)-N(3))-methyltransferase RlmH [Bacillota bacterium]